MKNNINNNKTIYFDMDGTIAGLFYVKDFQKRLNSGDMSVYLDAKPLFNATDMEKVITLLKDKGYKIGIISYVGSNTPQLARKAKKQWLKKYFNYATEIHIIQNYKTKYQVAHDKNGILFDDSKKNRQQWKAESVNAFRADLVKELYALL